MSDLQQYKKNRMAKDPELWKNYEEKFETFKLGILFLGCECFALGDNRMSAIGSPFSTISNQTYWKYQILYFRMSCNGILKQMTLENFRYRIICPYHNERSPWALRPVNRCCRMTS